MHYLQKMGIHLFATFSKAIWQSQLLSRSCHIWLIWWRVPYQFADKPTIVEGMKCQKEGSLSIIIGPSVRLAVARFAPISGKWNVCQTPTVLLLYAIFGLMSKSLADKTEQVVNHVKGIVYDKVKRPNSESSLLNHKCYCCLK